MSLFVSAWIDQGEIDALLSGEAESSHDALLASGQAMRSPGTDANLVSRIRTALPAVLAMDLSDVEDGAQAAAAEAGGLLEAPERGPLSTETAYAVALLRDDLESLLAALTIAIMMVPPDAADEETLVEADRIRCVLADLGEVLDLAAEPHLETLARLTRQAAAPEALAELVSVGPNPWWVELADPRARARWRNVPDVLAALREQTERLAAGAGEAGAVNVELRLQGDLRLKILAQAAGQPHVHLLGPLTEQGPPVILEWGTGPGTLESVEFARQAGIYAAATAPSLLEAAWLAVRRGDQRWNLLDS